MYWIPVRRLIGRLGGLCAALAVLLAPASAIAQPGGERGPIPSFPELEAAGAVIGEIRIDNQNIFDLSDPRESNSFYRAANFLHIRTRPGVVRRTLLFKSGDRVSAQAIEESERLLRGDGNIYEVRIRPAAYRDGVVDVEVTTRDTWSLDPGLKFSRGGGVNTGAIGLKETNLLGTGVSIGYSYENELDRDGEEFSIGHKQLFGSWTAVEYMHGDFSDGKREKFRLERPFYALDARWAAGASATKNDQVDSIFNGNGGVVGQYRHHSELAEVYGGWSRGLVDGWTRRYSVGIQHQDDRYRAEPGLTAPAQMPVDRKLAGPFVRYEVIEDDFRKVQNRDWIARTEFLQLGFNAMLQLGRAMTGLGSTQESWLYSAKFSDGIAFTTDQSIQTTGYAKGQYGDDGGEHQSFGAGAKYYYQQRGRGLFFASIAADGVANGDAADQVSIGGDSGLRGYPTRYQFGTRRALLTLEQRLYTDWFPFRLFRVGAAAFVDYGRAWGGDNPNTVNPGWLGDVGVGLRIFSDRSASGRVLHLDLAFPTDRDPGIDSYQILVKSKSTF
jgi:hypothetical protein